MVANMKLRLDRNIRTTHKSFIINLLHLPQPFVGASPDGIVNCSCCGSSVVEIKCPYTCKNKKIYKFSVNISFNEDESGSFKLKENHQYFYQVQMQIKLLNILIL